MQKKSGDFRKNCSCLKLVMLLVLSAVVVMMSASFAFADVLPVGGGVFDINLTANTGFNFTTGSSTASLASADIFYNGTSQPNGMGSQNDGVYRIWLAFTNTARISGMGPNINLDYMYVVMSKDMMPTGSSQRTFPVYQVDDGINLYTENLNYVLIKVTFRNASLLRFSYKMNNQSDNQTIGVQPTFGCYAQTTKTACFGAGACFWDDHAMMCKDNTATGGGGDSGGGGALSVVMCSAFNVKIDECAKINKSLCYNQSTSCIQNVSFNPSRGVRCEDITEGNVGFRQGMCEGVPLMPTCCSWDNANTQCVSNATRTSCKARMNNMTAGAMRFCEDAGNSSSECTNLKNNNYMPCRFDNSSTPERISNPKCVFDTSSVFGTAGPMPMGGGLGGGGFMDISTQAACQAANGNWKTFTYEKVDPLYGTKSTVTESHCEMGFGNFGGGSSSGCDTSCNACESNLFGLGKNFSRAANSSTQAKIKCENSSLGVCKFQNISNAPNGLGFCNFDVKLNNFGGGGNCQNDCFACFGQTACDNSKANCTYTLDSFAPQGLGIGKCDPKAFINFNSCATNCNACSNPTQCNSTALNTGGLNCTWIDAYVDPTRARLAGINPDYGYVGCVKVNNSRSPNVTAELCFYPGDEDNDGQENCRDSDCMQDPACGFGIGGGFRPTIDGGGPAGGPMNSSSLGLDANCQQYSTAETCNAQQPKCFYKSFGTGGQGICDMAFNQQMQGSMMMDAPPTIVGTDAASDAGGVNNQSWLDIVGVGFHESPDKIDLGMALTNITRFTGCSQITGSSANQTGKYYRFIDSDGNTSSGCNSTAVGGLPSVSGFEYKVVHENNGSVEVKLLFRCTANYATTPKWQLVPTAQLTYINMPCFIDPFMAQQGIGGVHVMIITKTDIGNPKNSVRFYVSTANATTNDTWPVDTAGPYYYTPGAVDYRMEDCATPNVDVDGDGYTSDQDPDCAKFKQYGFVPMEAGPKCKDNIDNDGNELTDCDDPGCSYDSFQCPLKGYKYDATDTTAPKTSLQQLDTFPDGGILKLITNEPTNATVEFYGNSSSCTSINETVFDISLTDANTFNDYKPVHDIHLDNFGSSAAAKLDYRLSSNSTYFFKAKTCDLSGNCAKSSCQNFTTKASASTTDCSTCSFVVSFDEYRAPPGVSSTSPLGNFSFTVDFGGDGVQDFNNTGGGSGTKSNYSVAMNTTITFTNPTSTEPWEISLMGMDIGSSFSSAISNLSGAFLYNASDGKQYIGMDGDRFDAILQGYGVDSFTIKLPVSGNKIKHCEETNLSNCVDVTGNLTKIADDGVSSTWKGDPNNGGGATGFSLYQVEGEVSFKSDKSSYGCNTGEQCFALINVTTENATLKYHVYNLSIGLSTLGGTGVNLYGVSTWNGTHFNYNGTSSGLSVAVNLSFVNLTDSPFLFKINFTVPTTFTKGGQFVFAFNATETNQSGIGYQNISISVLRPYVDIINVTSPANSASITDATTTFTYTLFSEFNGNSSLFNQTCHLRMNGTIVNSSLSVNGTSVSLSNNVSITDGTYPWNVSCTNNESETGYSATRSFTGGVPPTVLITSPASSSISNDNTTTITFTINDSGGINNQSTLLNISNGVAYYQYNVSTQGACTGSTTSFSCSLTMNNTNPLAGADWTANITSNDNGGNLGFAQVTYTVDLFAPVLSNVTISDNYVTNSTVVVVSINVTDNQTSGLNVTLEYNTVNRTSLTKIAHPFWNGSVTLIGAEGVNTLTIRVFDNATNSQTTTASYWIDTTSPVISYNDPSANGTTVHTASGNVTLNWSVTDTNATSTNVTVYDNTGVTIGSSVTANTNGSIAATFVSLKPGSYSAQFGAVDGAGNNVKTHTSAITFTVNAQQNTTIIEEELNASFGSGTKVQLLNSSGQVVSGNAYFNQTLLKKINVNGTAAGVNITVNLTALGTNFNENKTNVISLTVLTTATDAVTTARSSGVNALDTVVLFKNMSQYIGDNNYTDSSGTKQWVPIAIDKALGRNKALFISDDFGKDLVILSQCASNTVPTTTPNKTNACYTNGTAFVNVYVPHLSGAGLADPQNGAPLINYTTPAEGSLPSITDANLVLGVLVQSVDLNTSSCKYNMSNNVGTALVATTSVTPTQVESSPNYTISVDTDTNLANGSVYNLTVQCASNSNNITTKTQAFKVNDTTRPLIKTITSSSSGTTTVTLTWTLTTNENATCKYTTSSTTNFTQMTNFGTTGAKSHTYAPSYTSDSSGTLYFACNDTSGNGNGLNYTNSSAFSVDVTEATTTAASSTNRGGGSTTTAITTEGVSLTKKWITPLNPGVVATMNLMNDKIPVTSLSLEVANRVEKVEIKVTKLDQAPATAVPSGTGNVHSYIKVDTQNLKAQDVKSAKFKFKVEKTWLTANNYQVTDVILTRYDGVKWQDLPTKSLGSTGGVETYEAVSPGFSTFAIVGRTKVEAVKAVEEAKKAEDAAKEPEVKEEPKVEEKKEEKKADAPVIPTQPKKPYTGWIVVLVIVVVAVAGYFVWQKKKNS